MRAGSLAYAFLLSVSLASLTFSQSPSLACAASAEVPLIRAEGLAERLGDILLQCRGGTAGAAVTGSLRLFLSINFANRALPNGATDAVLAIDNGASPPPAVVQARQLSPNSLVFEGFSITIPTSRTVSLRVRNLRGEVYPLGLTTNQPIQVFLAMVGPNGSYIDNNQLWVGIPERGLLAAYSSAGINCQGASLPSTSSLTALFTAKAKFVSTRITEGFATAFRERGEFEDTGTRIVVRYAGFPPGARLYVPDLIAGSDTLEPTSGGDLGLPRSGGRYAPSETGSLLLARVPLADASGAGGTPVYTPPPPGAPAVLLDSASEVALANGAGVAVYEVVDDNPSLRESAQFPTFLGIPPVRDGQTITATEQIAFGPLAAPVAPASDCQNLGDCDASYFPHLSVDAPPLEYQAAAGSGFQIKYLGIYNRGAGVLNWIVSVAYKSDSDWLRVFPLTGTNTATLRVDAMPEKLVVGTYEATLTIDAGPLAGSRTFPVRFVVTPPSSVTSPPGPLVESVTNAASFAQGPLVAGSLATVFGKRLAGKMVFVTLDGILAQVFFSSDTQINLQIPPELRGRATAQLVVNADGVASAPYTAGLTEAAPAVFVPGILNQDNSVNSAASPAVAGSVVQIFATGLLSPSLARVTATISGREIATPAYAGPAPGLAGVDQVNLAVPDDLPAMTTGVVLCAVLAGAPGRKVCSPPARIVLSAK